MGGGGGIEKKDKKYIWQIKFNFITIISVSIYKQETNILHNMCNHCIILYASSFVKILYSENILSINTKHKIETKKIYIRILN